MESKKGHIVIKTRTAAWKDFCLLNLSCDQQSSTWIKGRSKYDFICCWGGNYKDD